MATALYRRYRPDTFAEVIGQEHVTDPLRAALRTGRVGQAYLFSGPRGCGKTTSARILARCLNCAQGPTDTPCGVCDSCVELARGGSGSLDVVEIDAASHGGVDDARELRERATFAPARDRQKVFIIDEAHMVTPQGFNALLKIVEEPPPHIAFIFATTEPDKVLGTIRSRTHHYPFRLVPPQVLQGHLQQVCDAEGVVVGTGVLPLVVRAGAGSVRDSLSVLDQLAAGAGPEGIDYEHAVALLGYTHATLLDDVTAAFAAGDGATVFRVVDRVISSGQDPRRFVDDLLQRLRDLVVVQAVGEQAHQVFPGVPSDQLERMALQAAGFGAAQLSRAADLANTAATEMTGATSPRLHLELLCARMLLPAADDGERGLAARLDRVERRLAVPGQAPAAGEVASRPAPAAASADAGAEPVRGVQQVRELVARRREQPTAAESAPQPPAQEPAPAWDAPPAAAAATDRQPAPDTGPAEPAAHSAAQAPGEDETVAGAVVAAAPDPVGAVPTGAPGGAETTEAVRRMWPEVLDHLATVKRRTWTRVSQDAQVAHVDGERLVLQFARPNTLQAFSIGPHADFVREALIAVLGLDRVVVAVNAGAPLPSGAGAPPPSAPAQPREPVARREPPTPEQRPVPPVQQEQPGQPRQAPQEHRSEARAETPEPRSEQPAPAQTDRVEAPRAPSVPGQASRGPQDGPGGRPPAPRAERPGGVRGRGRGASAPPPWDDAPPPEPPEDDAPPEFDDPWSVETGPRAAPRPGDVAAAPSPDRGDAAAPARGERSAAEAAPPAAQRPAAAAAPAAPQAEAAAPSRPQPPSRSTPPSAPSGPLRGAALARSAVRSAAASAGGARAAGPGADGGVVDDEPSRDDRDAEGSGQVGLPVVERLLGGRVVSVDERS